MAIAIEFERAETQAREGTLTETQLRKVLSDLCERVTGHALNAPTIREWLGDWLTGRKGTAAQSTIQKYEQVTRDFLAHLGKRADARLESITSADLISFRKALLEGGRTTKTADQVVRKVLSAPFTLATKLGQIAVNPLAGVSPLRHAVSAGRSVFRLEQIGSLVDAAPTDDWKGAILCGFYTGARLQDVTNLQWSNVDLERRLISFTTRKTGTKVLTAIHPDLFDHLCPLAPLARNSSTAAPRWVFPSLAGLAGSGRDGLSNSFKKIMAAAGVDGGVARARGGPAGRSTSALSFHSLRHTFNSTLANAGVAQELRQKLTGHASTAVNAQYTHHEIETLRRAVDAIPRLPKGEKA